MINIKMFSIALNPKLLNLIKKMNYIPVGLGENNFSNEWTQDNSLNNISKKNSFYGEYTFHYWLWKNKSIKFNNNEWIGFCQYRKFWKKNNKINSEPKNFDELNSLVLKFIFILQSFLFFLGKLYIILQGVSKKYSCLKITKTRLSKPTFFK